MNCCDDYGNCRQGRDCPVRKERYISNKQVYTRIAVLLALFWGVVGFLLWWSLQ